jgi:hypothetical protein
MKSLGFDTLLKTSTDKGSIGLNAPSWETSSVHLFSRQLLRGLAQKVGHRIGRYIRFLEETSGLGSAYTMVFRKSPHDS